MAAMRRPALSISISAKPTDQFEAMASADIGNYHERRFEGMINIPILDDRFDLRIAGEWTKRQGYSFDSDDRPTYRWPRSVVWPCTLGFKPTPKLQTYLVWEHFSEDDDRLRSSKQLCKTAPDSEQQSAVYPFPPLGAVRASSPSDGALDPAGLS